MLHFLYHKHNIMKFNPLLNTLLFGCIIVAIFAINQIDFTDLLSACDFKKQFTENPWVFYLILLLMLCIIYNIVHRIMCSPMKIIYETLTSDNTASDNFKYTPDELINNYIKGTTYNISTSIDGKEYALMLLESSSPLYDQATFTKCNLVNFLPQPILVPKESLDASNTEKKNAFKIIPIYLSNGDFSNTFALSCNLSNNPQQPDDYIVSYMQVKDDIDTLAYLCTIKSSPSALTDSINGLILEPVGENCKFYFIRGTTKYYLTYNSINNIKNLSMSQDATKALVFSIT